MRRTSPSGIDLSGRVPVIIADICRRIGGNIESELLSVLAAAPSFLAAFWPAIEPAFDLCLIFSAADELRRAASQAVREMTVMSDHLSWLAENGYSREDSRQIRYVVEVFYNTEPVLAILAGVARRWATGEAGGTDLPTRECVERANHPVFTGPVATVDDASRGNVTPPLWRALDVWSGYSLEVREELATDQVRLEYLKATTTIKKAAEALSNRVAACVAPSHIVDDVPELGGSFRRCMHSSCDATVLTGALRRTYIKSEVSARSKRIRDCSA